MSLDLPDANDRDENYSLLEGDGTEFDYYLQWQWPDHIETALRRMMWTALVELAEDPGSTQTHTAFVRMQMASHPETPKEVLQFLSTFRDERLDVRIAENPQASAFTLTGLATSPERSVKIAVAEHPNTPPETIAILAEDADLDLRYAMAENPHLSTAILEKLGTDENPFVASRAQKTLARRNPALVKQVSFSQRRQVQAFPSRRIG
jgi:hypothetical protein